MSFRYSEILFIYSMGWSRGLRWCETWSGTNKPLLLKCEWNVNKCRFFAERMRKSLPNKFTHFLPLCDRGADEGPHGICASRVHISLIYAVIIDFLRTATCIIWMNSFVCHPISRLFANADILDDYIINDGCTLAMRLARFCQLAACGRCFFFFFFSY